MSWNTLYIAGRPGFKEEVLESLENSNLSILPGSTGNELDLILLWVDDHLLLREVKKAIGSKVVFKYRLNFFSTLEEHQQMLEKNSLLSPREEAMIREMNNWQQTKDYLHSA